MVDFLIQCAWISFQAFAGGIVISVVLGLAVTAVGLTAVGIAKVLDQL